MQQQLLAIHSVLIYICLSACWLPVVLSKKYVQRPARKLRSAYVTGQREACSKLACVAGCKAMPGCRTVSWGSSLQLCLMSNQDVAKMWDGRNVHSRLEANNGWVTYGEIFYPVAHFFEGRYSYSFAAAKQACINQGTELATEGQMIAARGLGLDLCRWGWLANGRIGMVRQARVAACHEGFSAGVIYHTRQAANAWCWLH